MIPFAEKVLTSLDNFFENKKNSDVILVFLLPVIVCFGLSYKLLLPLCDRQLTANKQKSVELKDKIMSAKAFLGQGEDPKQFAVLLNGKLGNLKMELADAKSKNSRVEMELSGMEFAYLDQDGINNFLDAIVGFSSKTSVKIQKISSTFVDMNNSVLKRKAVIDVNASGDFKNIMYLIGDMENSKFLAHIDEVKLTKAKGVEASLSISLFGLNR